MKGATRPRSVNPRGAGENLREEILQAADRLLAQSEPPAPLTLRSIAREAGIAAPSIYPHFADRDAILDEIVERGFCELAELCQAAASSAAPGADEVVAICRTYLAFARDQPGRYRLLFARTASNINSPPHEYTEGLRAFDLLTAALSRLDLPPVGDDLALEAQALMVGLHGLATLPPAIPGFPWAQEDDLLAMIVPAGVTRSSPPTPPRRSPRAAS